MNGRKWILAHNSRPRMTDGVEVTKEKGYYSIYRYIDDWDEEGDSIYCIDEYVNDIPDLMLMLAVGATDDEGVIKWMKKNLVKKESNALYRITEFLDQHGIPYTRNTNGVIS